MQVKRAARAGILMAAGALAALVALQFIRRSEFGHVVRVLDGDTIIVDQWQ